MTFADLLKEYIGNRTLEEVVLACANRGVQIDAPLLSRMRQGTRLPPAEESTVRVLAEVCGRDPEPLLLLAQYLRNPHKVMESIISEFVAADKCMLWLQDQTEVGVRVLRERFKKGESVSLDEVRDLLSEPFEEMADGMRDAYYRHRDRAFEIIDLVVDVERASLGIPGELGTLDVERVRPTVSREEELITRLSEVTGIPDIVLEELISAGKRISARQAGKVLP